VSRASSGPARGARVGWAVAVVSLLVLAGCSSDGSTAATPSGSGTTASTEQAAGTTSTTSVAEAVRMRGDRYCEVLLVDIVDGQASADVYVSYPLNDCPEEQWVTLDTAAIAAAEGSAVAVLNGPRYWLMDRVEKERSPDAPVRKVFGGIEMQLQASVQIGALADASTPYTEHEVNRSTTFTFDAGQTVYELRTPDGSTYVMQTWSQQKDPTLAEADLDGLASRLQLPAGWSYASRVLDEPLVVDTTATAARVLQDDLANSYSFVV
jgi:hypothetical protein